MGRLIDGLRWLARGSGSLLAFLGAMVLAVVAALAIDPGLRENAELHALRVLGERNPEARQGLAQAAALESQRRTRFSELPRDQAAVAAWLARKYRVGVEPVAVLVWEAHHLGGHVGLEPLLLLAVIAIESNFNPYAQSVAGAQGLMQVVTGVHAARFARFGGAQRAFDPLVNLHVGAEILRDCIALRDGSLEGGLRYYFGGGGVDEDNGQGYTGKVLAERARLAQVAAGVAVPLQ